MTQLTAGEPEAPGARFDGKGGQFPLLSTLRGESCVFEYEGNENRCVFRITPVIQEHFHSVNIMMSL